MDEAVEDEACAPKTDLTDKDASGGGAQALVTSATPESHRRLKKAVDEKALARRRSLTDRRKSSADFQQSQRASFTSSGISEDSESSRKSSLSSGRKRSLFPGGGGHHRGDSKQFAVTFFVSENDKTKLVDILHKAKTVISKKVEKVMGRKVPKSTNVSSAEALTSILENWVSQEEERGKEDDSEIADLIDKQREQVDVMKSSGLDPPIRYLPIPSVVSPVPEEDEDEEEESGGKEDISVQEIVQGEATFLRPPQPFHPTSRSITPTSLSPRRSLSPVPRHFNLSEDELYPPLLRRPSSHYGEQAQLASSISRPLSPRPNSPPAPPPTSPVPKSPIAEVVDEERYDTEPYPASTPYDGSMPLQIQRPESMVVPIGGVWRPEDDSEGEELFPEEDKKATPKKDAAAEEGVEDKDTAEDDKGNGRSFPCLVS